MGELERVARALCRVWSRRAVTMAVKMEITTNPDAFREAEKEVVDKNWSNFLEEAAAAVEAIRGIDSEITEG